MKKIVLLFILAFIFKNSDAQQYYPFPTSNAFWLDGMESGAVGWPPGSCSKTQHTIVGDTVINSIIYHKLEASTVFYYYQLPLMCVYDSIIGSSPFPGYQGAFREDTTFKKVYYVAANDSSEKLMYDFDLNVGDTMLTELTVCSGFPVTGIDSVIVGGLYHKRYTCSQCGGIDFSIIEGVGGASGLFAPLCQSEGGESLICFNVNNVGVYPDGSSCEPLVLGIENVAGETALKIFPNPCERFIHLAFPDFSLKNISIYNFLGEQMIEKQTKEKETDFDLGHYPKGVYFFKVICGDKISLQRFILM